MNPVIRVFALLVVFFSAEAQPVVSSKQILDDVEVYRDLKRANLFYYAPGDLRHALHADGKPKFQLLEMRYTGSSAYGDNGETRFLNVVQFTVSMEQASTEVLKSVRQQLRTRSADLRPLPVRSIDAFLVAPLGESKDGSAYKKIGQGGSFQAEGKNGTSDQSGFWTERTFTLKLENHEAQLLWDQVASGQLALSLAYSFYADMVFGANADMEAAGDGMSEKFQSATEDVLTTDTVVVTHLVRADAFPIRVDVARWPDLLKRIDINEGVPPGYAALEVRCYDFTEDLRPDLNMKAVEIQATGVGGTPVTLAAKKFLRNQPDLNAIQIHFPYAVKLTEPFRYRVVEYTLEGSKNVSDWITQESWTGLVDITTPGEARKFLRKSIEVEAPPLRENGVEKIEVLLFYIYRGESRHLRLAFNADNPLPIQIANIRYDVDTDLEYAVAWYYKNGERKESARIGEAFVDDYIYLSNPAKE